MVHDNHKADWELGINLMPSKEGFERSGREKEWGGMLKFPFSLILAEFYHCQVNSGHTVEYGILVMQHIAILLHLVRGIRLEIDWRSASSWYVGLADP